MYINISVGASPDWSITFTKIDRSLDVFFSYPYKGQRYLYLFSFDFPPKVSTPPPGDEPPTSTPLHKYMKRYLVEPPIPVGGDSSQATQFVYLTDHLLPGYNDRIPKCSAFSLSVAVEGGSIYFSKLVAGVGEIRTHRYNIGKDGFVAVKFGAAKVRPPRVIKLKFGDIKHLFLLEKDVEDQTFFAALQKKRDLYRRMVSKMFIEVEYAGRRFIIREGGNIELGALASEGAAYQSDVLKHSLEEITSLYASVDGVKPIEMYEYNEDDVTVICKN
jgi:hypothetical protein